ncbi:unnamed protein product [Prorocentrum cordatum]|uniref:Uncharacterized protein n=1 Tax=Prorocentrum cordatum TaxID=2364126 RepID=A0ABN9SM29_9DINO|nr:unnamed protein product [Polarella glacialis]
MRKRDKCNIWRCKHTCVATGSFWPRQWLIDTGVAEDGFVCQRCDAGVPIAPFRMRWLCSGSADVGACVDARDLEDATARGHESVLRCWRRGLVPASLTQSRTPPVADEF